MPSFHHLPRIPGLDLYHLNEVCFLYFLSWKSSVVILSTAASTKGIKYFSFIALLSISAKLTAENPDLLKLEKDDAT